VKVLHLYRPRLPATRAQSIQVLGTCHGLARAGVEVTLFGVAGAPGATPASALAAHGLEPHPNLELSIYPGANPALAGWWYRARVLAWLSGGGRRVVYARAKRYAAQVGAISRIPVVLEAHEVDSAQIGERGGDPAAALALERRVLARARAVTANCAGTLGLLREVHGDRLPPLQRVIHNATAAGRARAWRPADEAVVGYAGSLRAYKGQATLLAAAARLPAGVRVELLGGSPGERSSLGALPPALRLAGALPYAAVPDRVAAWRAALLPLDADLFGSRLCNPLKVWEYLAVGLPIIAADLPTLREVLGPAEASWYTPGDPSSLVGAIARALTPEAAAAAPRRLRSWADRADEVAAVLEATLSAG